MAARYELLASPELGKAVIGVATPYQDGWRFMPRISGRVPSRKVHATALDSVPAWARKWLDRGEWRKVEA